MWCCITCENKIDASDSKGNSMSHGENSTAVQHSLNFLRGEYLQIAQTSLPKGTIHLLGLYCGGHFKKIIQSSLIHTDRRPNPKNLIVSSEKRLTCDCHSWPGQSRADSLTILGWRCPVPPKPELGAHLPCQGVLAGLAAGAAEGESGPHQQLQIPVQINADVDEYRTWVYYLCLFEMTTVLIPAFCFDNIKTFLLIHFFFYASWKLSCA